MSATFRFIYFYFYFMYVSGLSAYIHVDHMGA